jgi:hypothetical protein
MRNVNSDSVVIVYYPQLAGGKFLINSLGLSNGCYFQDIECVKLQRNNKFSPELKLRTLLERLGNTADYSWGDLGFGCSELFGMNVVDTDTFFPEIDLISYEKALFFVVSHDLENFEQLNNIWPNAKKIYLTNYAKFIEWRSNSQYTQPEDTELLEQYEFLIWDVASYLDKSQYLTQLETFYSQLGLPDFNQHYVKTFYNKYIEKLTKIKKHDIRHRRSQQKNQV